MQILMVPLGNICRNALADGHFVLYGFQPLETPAMENMDTFVGKYGEAGDKLTFRIRFGYGG